MLRPFLIGSIVLLVAACASTAQHGAGAHDGGANHAIAAKAAEIALSMQGQPYRYGGASPTGFDCSGLVQYAYRQAGASIPRTTTQQYRRVRQRHLHQLEPGDVIFFRTKSAKASHVGIYVGNDRFVHALNADHPVRVDRIDQGYWNQQVIRAGSLRL